MLSALGQRTVNKCHIHKRNQVLQCRMKYIGHAKCFHDNTPKLIKYRGVVVGLVMLLISYPPHSDQGRRLQPRQLPLDGS